MYNYHLNHYRRFSTIDLKEILEHEELSDRDAIKAIREILANRNQSEYLQSTREESQILKPHNHISIICTEIKPSNFFDVRELLTVMCISLLWLMTDVFINLYSGEPWLDDSWILNPVLRFIAFAPIYLFIQHFIRRREFNFSFDFSNRLISDALLTSVYFILSYSYDLIVGIPIDTDIWIVIICIIFVPLLFTFYEAVFAIIQDISIHLNWRIL